MRGVSLILMIAAGLRLMARMGKAPRAVPRMGDSGENPHAIERFTRVGEDTILYRVRIDDPESFVKPWTLEYPFLATAGSI